ncbi:hypothetical protein GCM10009535_38040 [Streptomyces thermocarboxydovorans]|uniref:Monooxygenase n=1 Tax=Streptomyces thermocarboxydovorans TaxID=59298 RepID=A0ABN1HJT7_9ACTN
MDLRLRRPRALVIGGSIAGMLAAAAVREYADHVEIVEAHELPDGPQPRAGVPQARHIHFLQTGGAEAVEALLPGTIDRLLAAGAHRIPVTTGMLVHSPEGWYRRWQRATHYLFTATRDLFDSVVREQVLQDTRITARPHSQVIGPLGGPGRITGIRIRRPDGRESEEHADLVVDASGRASRTPHWLAALGITGLTEERIDSGLTYASRLYRAPAGLRNWPVVAVQADPGGPSPANAGGILPVEGDRWHVSLMGAPGGRPTGDPEAFEQFARTLRHPVFARLLERAEPLTGVSVTHSTANRRYRYERLKPWPRGLVVLGDAAAACNPAYGHGMSVAAQSALARVTPCQPPVRVRTFMLAPSARSPAASTPPGLCPSDRTSTSPPPRARTPPPSTASSAATSAASPARQQAPSTRPRPSTTSCPCKPRPRPCSAPQFCSLP